MQDCVGVKGDIRSYAAVVRVLLIPARVLVLLLLLGRFWSLC